MEIWIISVTLKGPHSKANILSKLISELSIIPIQTRLFQNYLNQS